MCLVWLNMDGQRKFCRFFSKNCWDISHVGNFGIITSKIFLSMLLNCFVNTKFFSFTSYKMFVIILSMDFIKANGLKWLRKSSIQDVNWSKYLFTVTFFFNSFNFDILLFGKFFKFVVLMSSLWWIGGKYKQSSLNLDILDNFLLVFFA